MEHLELIRQEAERRSHSATTTMTRGLVMIVLVPVVLVGAVFAMFAFGGEIAILALLLGAIYAVLGSIGGSALILAGGVEKREAKALLRDIDAHRQLPEARVIKH